MKKNWLSLIPHPVVLLFGIFVLMTLLSYLLPSGLYETELVDGRSRVVAGSYHEVEKPSLNFVQVFTAIPLGFRAAIDIIFIVISSGIMFGQLERSGMIENIIGTSIIFK